MGRIVAPPYDVINETQRRELEASHPNNVVRLILPGEAGRADDGTFYRGAAALLRKWREEGTLQQDSRSCLYPYRQTFRGPDGTESSRLGFFGALEMEAARPGAPLPHEKTLEAPRRDRTRLITACRANLSPIFLIHPDETEQVGARLERAAAGEALLRFSDLQGVTHELWRLEDRASIEGIRSSMEGSWTLIADGHHRYESAQAVMQDFPEEAGARQVLAFFCSLKDRGFRIFPIHRLVRGLDGERSAALLRSLTERMTVTALPAGTDPEELLSRLREGGAGTFAAVLPIGPPLLLKPRPARDGDPGAGPPVLEDLDTVVLQREVLSGILGISSADAERGAVGFTPDAREAFRQVRQGEAAAAFLLNPLRIDAVIRAARSGLRLPQKSTYFFPKVFTGLVIRPFDS
jgi:uncharacterized protein (DUF1015 family)